MLKYVREKNLNKIFGMRILKVDYPDCGIIVGGQQGFPTVVMPPQQPGQQQQQQGYQTGYQQQGMVSI